jgi:hypothetical protein
VLIFLFNFQSVTLKKYDEYLSCCTKKKEKKKKQKMSLKYLMLDLTDIKAFCQIAIILSKHTDLIYAFISSGARNQ